MLELSTSQVFGNNGPLSDNNFVVHNPNAEKGPDQIVFSAGCLLGAFNVQSRTTRFFESKQQQGEVDALTISPDEKWIATAYYEASGDGTQLVVYRTFNRKCSVSLAQKGRVQSMCFTEDSKQLICACEDSIYIWSWESEKLDFSSAMCGAVSKISCPPKLSGPTLLITSTGKNHSRLWMANSHRISNTRISLNETEERKYDFRDHAWLANVGSEKSLMLAIVVEPHHHAGKSSEGSSINIYKIHDGISSSRPRLEFDQAINAGLEKGVQIATISLTPKGFALGSSKGIVFFDHKQNSEGKNSFINSGRSSTDSSETILSIKRSKSDPNRLFLLSDTMKLYQADVDDALCSNDAFEEVISDAGHLGGVDDIDCCAEKPYIVSCGKDSKVKIWDYEERQCIVSHASLDEPKAVAIHPSGHQLIIGYKDKLAMYHVLACGLKEYREVQCQSSVRQIEFSPGGHKVAAVIGNAIYVYPTYQNSYPATFLLDTSFTGHVGPIDNLTWAGDLLFSTGSDRNIYGWDTIHGSRIDNMNVLQSIGPCKSIVVSSSHTLYNAAVAMSDGSLHKLAWSGKYSDESKPSMICKSTDDGITTVCLSPDKSFLFAGTMSGMIRCYNWRSSSSENDSHSCLSQIPLHQRLHNSSLRTASNDRRTQIALSRLSATRNLIVSAGGIDGAICICKVKSSYRPDDDRMYGAPLLNNNIVLISSEEYDEKKEIISELNNRIQSLKSEYDFQLHSRDTLCETKIQELTSKTDMMLEIERERYAQLQQEHEKTIENHTADISSKDESFNVKSQRMEELYERRIGDEMKRCNLLREEMKCMQGSFDESLQEQKHHHEEQTQTIKDAMQKEKKSLQAQITQLQQELAESDKVFREILDQQEEEYEMELLKLQASNNSRLNEEILKVNEAKGTLQTLNSRKKQLLKQNEELRHQNSCSDEAVLRETELRYKLQDEIKSMRSEVMEHKNNLQVKSKEMQKLTSENRSLVSQKSLLETEMEELQQEKIPMMSSKIATLGKEITALSYELKKEHDAMKKKEIAMDQHEAKLKSQMKRLKQVEGEVRAWKREFTNLARLEDGDEIKSQIDSIYSKRIGA